MTLRAADFYSSGWYDFLDMVRRHFSDKNFSYFNVVGGDSGKHPEGIYPSLDKLALSSPLGTVAVEEIKDVPDMIEKAADKAEMGSLQHQTE